MLRSLRGGLLVAFAISLSVLLGATRSGAQSQFTQNKYVGAEVQEGSGLVTIVAFPGSDLRGGYFLSYHNKSFVTFLIDGKYYTNSDQGPSPTPDYYLTNGVTTKIPGAGGDTIRTTWTYGAMDIIQNVYPYAFEKSGQIVMSWKIRNRGGAPINAQVQYLLDIDVIGQDKAKILTRWGYSPNWNQYPNPGSGKDIPPFFISFQNPLPPGPPSYDPGKEGTGYFENSELGLIKPANVTIGDWTTQVLYRWGGPTPVPNTAYGDNAILIQWNALGINPGTTGELGRTSYGTGEWEQCVGNLFAITFYPHRIRYNSVSRIHYPNPFTVTSLIFNANDQQGASSTNATLSVGPNLEIVGPTPIAPDKKSQNQPTNPTLILPLDVSVAEWQVKAIAPTSCVGDFASYLHVDVAANGPFNPAFGSPCDLPLTIECALSDTNAPVHDNHAGTSQFDSTFQVHDSRPTDLGLKNITWNVSSGPAANLDITVNPGLPITGCPMTPYGVAVKQKDSTISNCVDFTFEDCAGFKSYYTMCFRAHPTKIEPDTMKPIITLVERRKFPVLGGVTDSQACYAQCDSFMVTDSKLFDRGLRSITVVTATNMMLNPVSVPLGAQLARFGVCAIDSMKPGSITVRVTDTSGNFAEVSESYCVPPDTLKPIVQHPYGGGVWNVHVTDNRPWDRGIDTVMLSNLRNVTVTPYPLHALTQGKDVFDFTITVVDTFQNAGFCIVVRDMAGNYHKVFDCDQVGGQEDIWKPHVTFTGTPDPAVMTVTVDDNHTTPFGPINYDTGIDSIWFTGIHNMTLTMPDGTTKYVNGAASPNVQFPAIHNAVIGTHPIFDKTPITFTLAVTDTAAIDSLACVTVHAVDGRQRQNSSSYNDTTATWCYPVSLDFLPPQFTGMGATNQSIDMTVTDNRARDRGLHQITLSNSVNFNPFDLTYNGDPSANVSLQVTTPGKSAIGTISALDLFGSRLTLPADRAKHQSSADVAIWAQDIRLKVAHIVMQSGNFTVPVVFVANDTFPIAQKKLSSYQFTFHIAGSPLVDFVKTDAIGTATEGWTYSPVVAGPNRTYTITATAPAGAVITDQTLPLVNMIFSGAASVDAGMTDIIVDGTPKANVIYNGGGLKTITGADYTLDVPSPYGNAQGGTVVIKGTCSPIINSGSNPTIVSLAPVTPNPSRGRTKIEYTVPVEGAVKLDLYSSLGSQIMTIVSETQKQGAYELTLDAQSIPEGIYFLRLEANGKVVSRRVILSH